MDIEREVPTYLEVVLCWHMFIIYLDFSLFMAFRSLLIAISNAYFELFYARVGIPRFIDNIVLDKIWICIIQKVSVFYMFMFFIVYEIDK